MPKKKKTGPPPDSDAESETMLSSPKVGARKNRRKKQDIIPPKEARPDLANLSAYRNLPSPQNSRPSGSQLTAPLNFDPDKSGASTPLSSVPSVDAQEELETLEQYLTTVPTGQSEDTCPLCNNPVPQEHFWEFWKGKDIARVRDQAQFCKEHKRREAETAYKSAGYPEINWAGLGKRLKEYYPRMEALLRNTTEKPSVYREAYAEKVAAGEERTWHHIQKAKGDIELTTGYYGARGARAMMEAITEDLQSTIKECAATDVVVSFSGFAAFVLRVLVPEMTICLVQEDFDIGEDAAREVIQESKELGRIVNEEIEDEVVRKEDLEDDKCDEFGFQGAFLVK